MLKKTTLIYKILFYFFMFILSFTVTSCEHSSQKAGDKVNLVVIYPPLKIAYPFASQCSFHPEGTLKSLGDTLGLDCIVGKLVSVKGRTWLQAYKQKGQRNEDWYGWKVDVLAPFDAHIEEVWKGASSNMPGVFPKKPVHANGVVFLRDDGMRVVVAHVQNIRVKKGDWVKAGQVVAQVGNNGMSRSPHIHIGAWKDQQPFQIVFDLKAMGKMESFLKKKRP